MLGRRLPRNENKNSSRQAAVSVDIIGKAELKTVIRRFLEDYDGPRMVSGFPRYLTFLPLFFTLTASSSVLSLFVISPLSLSLYPLVPPTGIIKNKPGLSEASVFVEKKEGKYIYTFAAYIFADHCLDLEREKHNKLHILLHGIASSYIGITLLGHETEVDVVEYLIDPRGRVPSVSRSGFDVRR